MIDNAVVLASPGTSLEEAKAARLLGFFGVDSRLVQPIELSASAASAPGLAAKYRIIGSAEAFLQLLDCLERRDDGYRSLGEWVHSVFVYSAGNSAAVQQLLRKLSQDDTASVGEVGISGRLVITDQMREFCGVMSGVGVDATTANGVGSLALRTSSPHSTCVVSSEQGPIVARFQFRDAPVLLSGVGSLIDLDTQITTRNFDVRDHFLAAVPIVLYTKWAFASTCWRAPETSACVVIDDPLLTRNYGFVNFQKLLEEMDRHGFSTNIAFIPWNCNRSEPAVARMFTSRPDRYSLSVHGCDHTAEEFGSTKLANLLAKAAQARERMSRHERRTGIRHDPVMVFPQGVFSRTAMGALKRSQFIAAVNTEVLSVEQPRPPIRVADVWDVAVMDYENFPIFTRRYPAQALENFAFDILLGKPCLVVIHHDYCRDQCAHLSKFVGSLNALNCTLTWRSLGEVVKRSCRRRDLSDDLSEVEMYGTRLWVENRADHATRFIVRRRETDPSTVREVTAGSKLIAWTVMDGRVEIRLELAAGQGIEVAVDFHPLEAEGRGQQNVSYRAKTVMRRYLSEIRDNYVATQKASLAGLFRRLTQ